MKDFTPPVTNSAARELIAPLNPEYQNMFSHDEKELAYSRLLELFDLLFPEESVIL